MIARDAKCRILVASMHENPLLVENAMHAGALGYVTKACGLEVMRQAVEKISVGEVYLGPDVAHQLAVKQLQPEETPLQHLSPREFEVFRLLAKGTSNAKIAEELHLSSKTISNYVSRIKIKLNIETTAEIVRLGTHLGNIES